jgi:hypothetical protein
MSLNVGLGQCSVVTDTGGGPGLVGIRLMMVRSRPTNRTNWRSQCPGKPPGGTAAASDALPRRPR